MSDNPEIDALKLKIFELEADIIANQVRIRALQKFFEIFCEKGNPTGKFLPLLHSLERSTANEALRSYADDHPTMASILKKYLDLHFPPEEKK